MAAEKHLNDLVDVIEGAVRGLNNSMPRAQVRLVRELESLLKELDLVGGRVKSTTKNLKAVSRIKGKLEALIINSTYEANVSTYMAAYDQVADLQKKYFATFERSLSSTSLLNELKRQSVSSTLNSLTRAGISVNVVDPIQDILRQNVTTGVAYSDMLSQLRVFVQGNEESVGHLSKYVKQITTDALNQYSAQYMDIVSDDLGLQWFQYSGVKIKTSRAFCVAMVNKRFFHKSELPRLLSGNFPEFKEVGGTIYPKTGLPDGMVPGTNPENFFVYRGGYNCMHQPVPIPETVVPKATRVEVYKLEGIPYDKDGFAVAA